MKKIVIVGVLVALLAVGYIVGKPMYDLHFSVIDYNGEDKLIYINSGSSLDDVAGVMEAEGIIEKEPFLAFAEELDFTEEKVEPGKYNIVGGMKSKNLIYALKNGNQEIKDVRITFNNCKTIEDMAGKVAPSIEADSAEIVGIAKHPETIEKYGFRDATFISMFLPDTYEVGEWDMTAEEFIQFMADQYKAFWKEEDAKLKASGLEQSEVATLASILEAEQGIHSTEWETIAGLYLNRVRRGMKLESDPTAKYCWGDELEGVQRILTEHLKKDCPYNTYLYAGLPPGPIRMPSKKALRAVLNAEDHNYIFMCARPDDSGLHNFAETYSQHLANARKFWKYMDSRGY
ncbi:MAG: endolytic transglycosylase MltG [Flavobacteriales bacterium]|nr:endolytic transglycosylase MltG [Flavobacteriales bacterium]